MSRAVVIFDKKADPALVQEEVKGKEALEWERVTSFSGELCAEVLFLCGDYEGFLKDSKTVDFILDKVLKVCGKFTLKCGTAGGADLAAKLAKHLKYSGFIKVEVKSDQLIVAEKDKTEVGEVKQLSFAGQVNNVVKISAGDDDYIDEDELLDEEDLKKPDPSSLRVCGTTGKRKACKDCSCGLAEELSGQQGPPVKSSCGNCYLGDAFRCSSCPYMGTPAFKPGEKVQLMNSSDL